MRRDDGELRRNWTENEAVDWMSAFDDDPVTELGQEIISLIGCFSRFPAGTQRWGSWVCADRKVQFGPSGLLRCPVTFCTDWKQQLRLNVDGLGPC